jgi:ABC-type polysaccharide/polyol phosphate transport system ATPase subunit
MAPAVLLDGVSKRFRLYHQRHLSLKEAFIRRGRGRYEEFWILRNLSLGIEAGTAVGVIGANGSGKSTALKLIARILHPNGGRIAVEGRVAALLELGTGFHPDYTGRENIFLNGALLGLRRDFIRRRLDEIVEFSGIEPFIDNPVKTYSSGMAMRLGFAIAVNVDSDVLLIDEVLAVGDAEFAGKCFERIEQFRAQGKTIVLVSHDLDAVRRFCDRAVLLDQGGIQADGHPEEVTTRYLADVQRRREHPEEQVGTMGSARWGTREVEITRAEILGEDGRPRYTFDSGDALQAVITYRCTRPILDPVFGVSMTRADGVYCYAANTRSRGMRLARIDDTGTVTFRVSHLNLVEGSYQLSMAITDYDHRVTYDHWDRRIDFTVRQPSAYVGGIVYMTDDWGLDGTPRVKRPR